MTSKGKQTNPASGVNSVPGPPKWVRSFLSNFLDERLLEGSLGDLEEKHANNIENGMWLWRANLLYVFEAIGFVKMASPKNDNKVSTFGHILHTLIFFTRLVKKDKSYYVVSMFGLALSLTSFLLISMFVVDELSYDGIHENRDRVFRITTHVEINDVDFDLATSQFPAAHALQSEFPEIEQATRLYTTHRYIEIAERKFEERSYAAIDAYVLR
jgi:putative ABC transport system permease protein